ncbi:L-serine ammonia-lyase [bacterium]|nr:L-serine ammonia-lyase [bacterium]
MYSIREIYRIGRGPSSSHTMAPGRAAAIFREKHPEAASFRITLYGSLGATGKGHLTDDAVTSVLAPAPVQIIWKPDTVLPAHPNGMTFEAVSGEGAITGTWTVYSIGGGALADDGTVFRPPRVYDLTAMEEILNWCEKNGRNIWEYVSDREDPDIWNYLEDVWKVMVHSITAGLEAEGSLPGRLKLRRKAASYHIKAQSLKGSLKRRSLVFAYALAAAEENAAGGTVVTAPTCGSCGVLPAVLHYIRSFHKFTTQKILRALATAGLVGNLVKHNASISGAEVGCQGEIGTACAMAAAAAMQLFGGTPLQVEYAAEMGLEHHLGLTCDPVAGLVQVPCIERNAFAASRALDANTFAMLSDGRHRVSFDQVVLTMKQTGHDLPSLYKETSGGGLAATLQQRDDSDPLG